MLGYLRTKLGIQKIYGIPFTSQLLFGLIVLWILRAFPLTCYKQIDQQCVVPMGWSSQESLFVVFSVVSCSFIVLFSFIFGGRIPHPSFVLLILSIYIFVVSYQKNTNKVGSKEKVSSQRTSKCLTTIFLQAFFSNVTLYQNMLVILSPNADT